MGLATDKHCKGCIYRCNLYNYLYCCDYFLRTGKRRPCPAGQGCTVKIKKGETKDVKN